MEKSIWRSKGYLRICLFYFVTTMGQFMTTTLLSKYADALGATATLAGMVAGIFSLSALLMKPVTGPAVDAFPKPKVLICGNILLITAFLGYYFASSVEALLIFRLIHGIAVGTNATVLLSMVADTLPEEKMTSGIAYFALFQSLAAAVGPTLGLRSQELFGYRNTFLASTFITAAAMLLILWWNIPEKGVKRPFRVNLQNCVATEAVIPALIMLCLAMAFSTIPAYLVIFASRLGVENISLYFTVNAVALVCSRPFFARLSEKYGIHRTLPISISIFALAMVTIGLARSLSVFLAAAVLVAAGYNSCSPMIQALCIESVAPNRRGAASATSYYGTDIGYLVSPLIAGWLIDTVDYSNMFIAMAVFPLLALVIFFFRRNHIAHQQMNK